MLIDEIMYELKQVARREWLALLERAGVIHRL
jgi:hypothetical protein